MNKRRNFTKPVTVEIIKRGRDPLGNIRCEECHAIARPFEIHHIEPDGLCIDKSKPLTAKEGLLLCISCHAEHTKLDVPAIARAKRIEARHLGVRTAPVRPIHSPGFPMTERAKARAERGPKATLPAKVLFR